MRVHELQRPKKNCKKLSKNKGVYKAESEEMPQPHRISEEIAFVFSSQVQMYRT